MQVSCAFAAREGEPRHHCRHRRRNAKRNGIQADDRVRQRQHNQHRVRHQQSQRDHENRHVLCDVKQVIFLLIVAKADVFAVGKTPLRPDAKHRYHADAKQQRHGQKRHQKFQCCHTIRLLAISRYTAAPSNSAAGTTAIHA